jgi:hypothetical protein
MADVFISYRHVKPDQDLAEELKNYCIQAGVSHFIDTRLRIGQKWIEEIDRELFACRSLVVLLSAESIRSDMVRHEVKLAHDWNKAIFPIRVDYDGALPYDLGAYLDPIQYKLWRSGEPFLPVCGTILDAIREGPTRSLASKAIDPSLEALRRLGEVTELRGAPLPSADPRVETGGLKLDSPFYVHRAADKSIGRLVSEAGETILIKGPRQVGKTSLAARARASAERKGQKTCYIDFQLIDESRLRDSSALFQYLAARLAKDLQTAIKPNDVWDDILGDADSLTDFLQQAVLPNATRETPVVLCLDEVDNVFQYPYCDAFFGTLRGWHNRRATHPIWNAFNLVIVHSTEPALFIRDLNQSPFNVGTAFRLGDFDREEIRWLNARHGSPLTSAEDLERLIKLVGGHPYLLRQGLYTLAAGGDTIRHLEHIAGDDDGPFGDHLRRNLWVMRGNERLRIALRQVLSGRGCDDEDDFQRLRAAGLVAGESRVAARPRCELYARYYEERL